jgi:hypothetical protein
VKISFAVTAARTTLDQAPQKAQRTGVPGARSRRTRWHTRALPPIRRGRNRSVAHAGLVAYVGTNPASSQFSGVNRPVPSM